MALHTHEKLLIKDKKQQMQGVWDKIPKDSEQHNIDIKAKMHPILKDKTLNFLLNN